MSFSMFDDNFKVEQSSGGGFLRLPSEDGKFIRFAVLSKVMSGYVYWNKDKRTVNLREKPSETPADIRTDGKFPDRVKQFIAFAAWDYEAKAVCVCSIETVTVINSIYQLVQSGDADPMTQFFKINRAKVNGKTEYQVLPVAFNANFGKPDADAYEKAAAMNLDDILFRKQTQADNDSEAAAAVDVAKAAEIM